MVTEHEKRELRQLWFIAQHYWGLAQELAKQYVKELDKGISSIACQFNSMVIPSKNTIEYALTLLGAHMASVATRVTSIDEVLNSGIRTKYMEILKHWNDKDLQNEFDLALKDYIAVMLRDNVGHVERNNKIYKRREVYLEGKTYKELYEALGAKLLAMALQLKKEGIVSCPDIH
jgi:hypothetical protein